MKIKGCLFFAIGTVVSMLCTPVLANNTGEINAMSILSNINAAALIAAAPSMLAALIESEGLIVEALPQIFAVVLENGLDFGATISDLTVIIGELIINIVATVGAASTNALLAAGLLTTLNSLLSDFLAGAYDPKDVTFVFNTSEKLLTSGVTSGSCTSTSYTYNISEVTISGYTDLQITKLTINDQTYEDNLFYGDIDFSVGGFDLETVSTGVVSEDKCGEMSNEEYDFSYKILGFEFMANIKLTGIVEGQNFTLKNLTIGSSSVDIDSESTAVSGLSFAVEDLKDTLLAEMVLFQDYIENGELLNWWFQLHNFLPFTFELPFEWPF